MDLSSSLRPAQAQHQRVEFVGAPTQRERGAPSVHKGHHFLLRKSTHLLAPRHVRLGDVGRVIRAAAAQAHTQRISQHAHTAHQPIIMQRSQGLLRCSGAPIPRRITPRHQVAARARCTPSARWGRSADERTLCDSACRGAYPKAVLAVCASALMSMVPRYGCQPLTRYRREGARRETDA